MHADLDRRLLAALADGKFHSGVALAAALGVSRGAVWQHIRALQERKLDIYSVRGKGYCINPRIELLDADAMRGQLSLLARRALIQIDVEPVVDSTNARLLAAPLPLPGRFVACAAEYQTAGHGRRGRAWLSPFSAGLCLSLACRLNTRHAQFGTLSLAVGVAVRRALAAMRIEGVELKWPNDLIVADRKLGGVLVELRGEASGPAHVVIGVGLNVSAVPERIGDADSDALPPVCLLDLGDGMPPGRNALAAAVLSSIVAVVEGFGRDGFAPFIDEWRAADYLAHKTVRIDGEVLSVTGTAVGIGDDGALRVETDGHIRDFISGEVSVRLRGRTP